MLRFVADQLAHDRRILIHSELGNDRAVAVAVAVLMSFFYVNSLQKDTSTGGESLSAVVENECGLWSDGRLRAFSANKDDALICTELSMSPEHCKTAVTHCLHLVSLAWTSAAPPRHTLKKLHRFFCEKKVNAPRGGGAEGEDEREEDSVGATSRSKRRREGGQQADVSLSNTTNY